MKKPLFKNTIKEEWIRTDPEVRRIKLYNKNYALIVVYKTKPEAEYHADAIMQTNKAMYKSGMTSDKGYASKTSAIVKKLRGYWAVYSWVKE